MVATLVVNVTLRGALAALAAAALVGCGGNSGPAAARKTSFLNQAPGVRYVGREACRSCHAETASTYAHTGMGRSFYPMTARATIEDFSRHNEFEVEGTGVHYRMAERAGKYFMRQFVVGARGREEAVDEREMIWVAGSGNHSRSYVTSVEGRLFQMPVCWYPSADSWDLCPGYEHENDYFSREISATCVFCHNARMEREPGTRNRYRDPIPAGIDCERCHGPGELHVRKWGEHDETPTGAGDATIVNPRRLPDALRIQVCFQCHLSDATATERVGRHDRALQDFRPGEPLGGTLVPFRYAQQLPEGYGIAGQADRFILSRCYLESGGKIECLTCHDPHVTIYRKDRPADYFRKKCLGCHAESSCTAARDARGAVNPPDDCVRCHMRRAEPDDHPHAVLTDHWIRKRIDVVEPRARTSVTLEPILREAFGELGEADRSYYTGRAYLLKGMDMGGAARRAALGNAEGAFRRAAELGLSKAEGSFFLGKTLLLQGRSDEAAQSFERAAALAPGYEDAAFERGQSLLRAKRIDDAASAFERILDRNAGHAGAAAELARCRLMANRPEEALAAYRKAILLEPWNARLHANEATILATLGRTPEALDAMREALRYGPGKPELWHAWSGLLREAGLAGEADAAEERARRLSYRVVPPDKGRGMMGM